MFGTSNRIIIFTILALLVVSPFVNAEEDTAPFLGKEAPAFSANTLDGKEIKLKDFEGKLVLVDFWATWCPPCKAELPHLREVYKKYSKKGLVIISISSEKASVIEPFAKKNEMVWHQISDSQRKISPHYKVETIPSPFLIGPDGTLLEKGVPLRVHFLEKTIEKHIDKVKPEALKKDDTSA